MNFDINRDYRIFYPILAIVIMILGITLPNMENYLSIIFTFASLLVGLYGAIRGKGSDVSIENTFGLHAGIFRLILGAGTLLLAITAVSIQAPEGSIMAIFGIAGELLGVAVPALASRG